MFEIALGAIGILGVLFIACKLMNRIARFCGLDEITHLMNESLSMRMGNFLSKRKR
jgi:hypothetical protein